MEFEFLSKFLDKVIDFYIVNVTFLDADVARRAFYGVYIFANFRYARVCNHVTDINARNTVR